MEKSQHMARVMNFRKLKIFLFSEAPQLRNLLFLHLFLPIGDQFSSSLLMKFWSVGLEMPAAPGVLSWAHCVLGGDGGSAASLESVLMPGGPVFVPDLCLASESCYTNSSLLILGFTVICCFPDFGSLPFPEGEM
jgi:hypothetical protein